MESKVESRKPRRRKHTRLLRRVNANAAGIDVGASQHFVAIAPDRSDECVRSFGAFTSDLEELARWLVDNRIETVALEATGVYWIPLYQTLEAHGLEVVLCNARQIKNVSGRKSDVLDCQWIQELHSFGLLRAAFRPPDKICSLRSYLRVRSDLVELSTQHVQHMDKALRQMNLVLGNVVSDITGKTGMTIIRSILAGERRPEVLAEHRDPRCRSSVEIIRKSLVGDYRPEHLFALKLAVELYDFYADRLLDCDRQIEAHLATFDPAAAPEDLPPQKRRPGKSRGQLLFDARTAAFLLAGVDLTAIPAIQALTALTIIAECGLDMSRFPTVAAFASWLGLAPGTRISGGRKLDGLRPFNKNRAGQALRIAVLSLRNSHTALGAFYRRKRAQIGPEKAVVATAHRLARILYAMLRDRRPYQELGQDRYEQQFKDRTLVSLSRRARSLGYTLVPEQPSMDVVS
jgi:transposase